MDKHQSELLTVPRIEKAEVIVQGVVTELFCNLAGICCYFARKTFTELFLILLVYCHFHLVRQVQPCILVWWSIVLGTVGFIGYWCLNR